MPVMETVCPRHALLAEQAEDGTIVRSTTCYWAGCDEALAEQFAEGKCWPLGQTNDLVKAQLID